MISVVSTFDDLCAADIHSELLGFADFGRPTARSLMPNEDAASVPVYINEFWTSKQRDANRLHEISYRACFKPQLPRFFIERLTKIGDTVFDPFMGRGTTLLEAALLGRIPFGCDVNPLCQMLIQPRLIPPVYGEVEQRLKQIDFNAPVKLSEELLVFYHPRTLRQICALRAYLLNRKKDGNFDSLDGWIRMVALNRLTGHSRGFFSVYTLPPNQAVSIESQRRINKRLGQKPDFRSVPDLIFAKTKNLLLNVTDEIRQTLSETSFNATVLSRSCESLPELADESVDLVVTSPPFLNVVNYVADNWLRCWFAGPEIESKKLGVCSDLNEWQKNMGDALAELFRVVRRGGHVAFEVGEIRGGKIQLEDAIIPAGISVGFEPELVLINSQKFTKTANCWGVRNNALGTNTNRVVLFKKPNQFHAKL